ncbi:uncharacterized protein [Rutidosis leptorrhynchoides]|uniref:uncharacterized protein n=1 Tax=Rutidosis leptorrhynchoides TaxID=125765 RepID=UPI003A99AB78
MEGVGARLGRSSTRYGPAVVFTGPVRKWKKKWIHVTPPNASAATTGAGSNHQSNVISNGNSSSNGSNDNGSHILLYKWTPLQSQSQNGGGDSNGDGDVNAADEEEQPPRRKIKYIPIALLEEQKKESEDDHIDEAIDTDSNSKDDGVNGKPDINGVPMEENEVSEERNVARQDLNENTLDLNARDGDEDPEETKDQTRYRRYDMVPKDCICWDLTSL